MTVLRFLLKCLHYVDVRFSIYINHNTARGLIGISLNGYPRWVSSLYADSTSEKITQVCGILDLLNPGNDVMAERTYDIESNMPSGVLLNFPQFLHVKPQLTAEDKAKTRKIASVWVHVKPENTM